MNFKNVKKYLSLILLVLAIFSLSIGVSAATQENSSTYQGTEDRHDYSSYYNYSYSYTDYESVSDLENPLSPLSKNDLNFNNTLIALNFHDSSSDEINNSSISNISSSSNSFIPLNSDSTGNLSSNSYTMSIKCNSLENNLPNSFNKSFFYDLSFTSNDVLQTFVEQNSNKFETVHLKVLENALAVFNNSNGIYKDYIFNKENIDSIFMNLLLLHNKLFNTGTGFFYINHKSALDCLFSTFNEDSDNEPFNKNLFNNYSTVDFSINKNLKNLLYNKNQIIKNNNSLFYILNNSKNNSKIFALNSPFIDDTSDDMDDDEEPSDSVYLANRLILNINFLKISNGLKYTYKVLDNTIYSYLDSANSISPLSLKTSIFNLLESHSKTTYLENNSFEIVDIRNDSINFGIITDYFNQFNQLNFNNLGIIDIFNNNFNNNFNSNCNNFFNNNFNNNFFNNNFNNNFFNSNF